VGSQQYRSKDKPTFYFIGVSTARSSIVRVFPEWVRYLGVGDCCLQGVDFKQHAEPEAYREIVRFIKEDSLSLGALVTTHKIDLLQACRDLFDELDAHAELMGEVSCISKSDAGLSGFAKDPISSGLALEAFLPREHWRRTGAEVFVIGAGGSSIALTCFLMDSRHGDNKPEKVTVANRSEPRLREIQRIHETLGATVPTDYFLTPNVEDNDAIANRLPEHSLVVNATGLGKDAPGSPISDQARFPKNGFVWEFNYRGDLQFLRQAERQKHVQKLRVEDGWIYFIHGWTRVLAEIFHIDIPTNGKVFEELSRIAAQFRQRRFDS
jgi:shikimate 5-dehydrogenase